MNESELRGKGRRHRGLWIVKGSPTRSGHSEAIRRNAQGYRNPKGREMQSTP